MAIALNIFSSNNALMGNKNFHNWKRKYPKRSCYLPKVRRKTLVNTMNLLLQLKVSDENNFKTQSIDLSSFEMQFLSCCYNIQAKIRKADSQFGCATDQCTVSQKINVLLDMPSPKYIVLLIGWILRVSVHPKKQKQYKNKKIVMSPSTL